MVTAMWAACGVDEHVLLDETQKAYVPIRVKDGSVHEVYDDWRRAGVINLTPVA